MNILNYISELNDLKNNLIYEDKLKICKVYEIEEWIVAAKLFFNGINWEQAICEVRFYKFLINSQGLKVNWLLEFFINNVETDT